MNEFLIKLIANGGKGSGNYNPGQGRGIGKPASGSGATPKTKAKKEDYYFLKPGEATVDGKPYESAFGSSGYIVKLDDLPEDANSYNVLSSVMGQLSDGMWENSPSMEKYWHNLEVQKDDNGKVFIDVNKSGTYKEIISDRWGTGSHWGYKRNGVADWSPNKIANFYSKKIKQIVKREASYDNDEGLKNEYRWAPDNERELKYMHSYGEERNPTVGDAYKTWDALKRKESKGEDDEY